MIGIKGIGVFIAPDVVPNNSKLERFGISETFLENKLGILSVSRKKGNERSSDLCVRAFEDLKTRIDGFNEKDIDVVCVCTQNGDYAIPHSSAIVHDKLALSKSCNAFDISLGCSGYVHSLQILKGFMQVSGFQKGLLFTSDQYSSIINKEDKNTDLLFGDAASVTYLTEDPEFDIGVGAFHTDGQQHKALIKEDNLPLFMDGRGIFNFVMREAPDNIFKCLENNKQSIEGIDLFIFHQASKFIIDSLGKRMKLDPKKVPFSIKGFGNTVSSSIPILLQNYIQNEGIKRILLSGFGVGLSIASLVLNRRKQ